MEGTFEALPEVTTWAILRCRPGSGKSSRLTVLTMPQAAVVVNVPVILFMFSGIVVL
jgi:hypothetical protein